MKFTVFNLLASYSYIFITVVIMIIIILHDLILSKISRHLAMQVYAANKIIVNHFTV